MDAIILVAISETNNRVSFSLTDNWKKDESLAARANAQQEAQVTVKNQRKVLGLEKKRRNAFIRTSIRDALESKILKNTQGGESHNDRNRQNLGGLRSYALNYTH